MLNITFYGVRGSTPCSCEATRGFGGNTACVLIEVDDNDPIILDLGTGLQYLGRDLMAAKAREVNAGGGAAPFRGSALVSHMHWDHIQGIPFFRPLVVEGSMLDVYGPYFPGSSLEAEFAQHIRPPVFPVALSDLPAKLRYCEVADEVVAIGSATVTCFSVPHIGPTNGYRIDGAAGSVAFICDHQQPKDGSLRPPDNVVEACRGVDVLIHDAQYDAQEFELKVDWGHCTADFALELARLSGARRLVLFHHDPSHDDDWIRDQVGRVQALAGSTIEVIGAAEGLTLRSG